MGRDEVGLWRDEGGVRREREQKGGIWDVLGGMMEE